MRPNSFKRGQKVKVIQSDGSLSEYAYVVAATEGHACWVYMDHKWSRCRHYATYGANELESVR